MSVFEGEIDFRTVYMVDYDGKGKPKSPRRNVLDDNCLIVGIRRDALKVRTDPYRSPDVLCPLKREYYKEAVQRFERKYPRLVKKYMKEDINPIPIDHEEHDLKRTEYLTKYCSRDLPFMSVNLARRARALQTLRLPDDSEIPDTSHRGSYRYPPPEKYGIHPTTTLLKPKYDPYLQHKLREILRIRTGETSYGASHGLLAKVILTENPFGPPRKEPKYGRWKTPSYYTYNV